MKPSRKALMGALSVRMNLDNDTSGWNTWSPGRILMRIGGGRQ
jgi:hypothetical protein